MKKNSILHLFLSVITYSSMFFITTNLKAATITGEIDATITLVDSCLINGATPTNGDTFGLLDFGSQPTLFTSTTSQVQGTSGAFTIQCQTTVAPTLKITSGTNDAEAVAAGGSNLHAMTHTVTPTHLVLYDIYSDSGTSTRVDNNNVFFTSANDGTVENVILYGKAFGDTTLIPGTYEDTLTLEFTF